MGKPIFTSSDRFLRKIIGVPSDNTLAIFFLALSFLGCGTGKNDRKSDGKPEQITQKLDSTYIFNGINLDDWEITNFGPQGPVSVSGGKIYLGMGDGCTGVTYKGQFPETDYRVTLDAQRVNGNDFFCGMTFPVGKDPCTLIVGGWGGMVVGLSSIDGMDASENETTTSMVFEKERWYRICLEVTDDSIKAFIDDVPVVEFEIGNKGLSIRPEVELSKPFGIASWTTTAAIRKIKLERFQ